MGLDPGIRTGVKVAVTDATGKVVATSTVYPFQPRNDVRGAQIELASLIRKHNVELISIGNGTGSRETEKLVVDMLADLPGAKPTKVIVSKSAPGLFGVGHRRRRISQSRRVAAWRRLHRAPPAGSAGRARQDRVEVDRRRPVLQYDVDQQKLSRSLDAG